MVQIIRFICTTPVLAFLVGCGLRGAELERRIEEVMAAEGGRGPYRATVAGDRVTVTCGAGASSTASLSGSFDRGIFGGVNEGEVFTASARILLHKCELGAMQPGASRNRELDPVRDGFESYNPNKANPPPRP